MKRSNIQPCGSAGKRQRPPLFTADQVRDDMYDSEEDEAEFNRNYPESDLESVSDHEVEGENEVACSSSTRSSSSHVLQDLGLGLATENVTLSPQM